MQGMSHFQQQVFSLLTSAKTRAAFDISSEPDRVVDRYGRSLWGSSLIIARRLVETGAKFVNVYLTKLQPNADVDWRHDPAEHRAYLDRLWSFAQKLAPGHNSLKAHVLYHRLVLDRSQGVYDKPTFMAYLQTPRNASYMNPKFMELEDNCRHAADLAANFENVTLLPPVGNDDPLVRSYLQQFFVKETNYEPYTPWVNDLYLKRVFAETKIVNGLGEGEQWSAMLTPAEYQALKDRIDLDFAETNKQRFAADDPVSLHLFVKNVRTLIVPGLYGQSWSTSPMSSWPAIESSRSDDSTCIILACSGGWARKRRRKKLIVGRKPTMWRYRESLPIVNDANIVSFDEGMTPMIPFDIGPGSLHLKLEQLFTTGSYKDRGAAVLISKAKELGIERVVEDSSGNAGCAIAAYAAKAGIRCEILVPASTSPGRSTWTARRAGTTSGSASGWRRPTTCRSSSRRRIWPACTR